MPPAAAQRRLYFALWPDKAVRRQLEAPQQDARAACGGRAMGPETLHLTLAFLGGVDGERVPVVEAAAAAIKRGAFEFLLDRLACWPDKHIVWMGADSVPEALAQLAADLSGNLRAAGFVLETRPFVPHVTLLRKAAKGESLPPARPILWPVRDFVLVESKLSAAGAHYDIIGRWGL